MDSCRKCKKPVDKRIECFKCKSTFHPGCLATFEGYSNIDTSETFLNSCPHCNQSDKEAKIVRALRQKNLLLKTQVDELKNSYKISSSSDENIAEYWTKLFCELEEDLISSLSDIIRQEVDSSREARTIFAQNEFVTDDSLENETDLNLNMSSRVVSATPDYVESDIAGIEKDELINTKRKIVLLCDEKEMDFIDLLKKEFPYNLYDFVPVVKRHASLRKLLHSDNIATKLGDEDIIAIYAGSLEGWHERIPDCAELHRLFSDNFGNRHLILLACPYYFNQSFFNKIRFQLNCNFYNLTNHNRSIAYLDPRVWFYNQCRCNCLEFNEFSTKCYVKQFVRHIRAGTVPAYSSNQQTYNQ